MSDRQQFLGSVPLFAALAPDELTIVAEMASVADWQAGESVFSMGDTEGSMFAVEEGVVELHTVVSGIEKLIMTVRPGGVFGLLSLIDRGEQSGSARAVEKTRAVTFSRESLDRLLETHPGIAAKLLSGIGATLGRQIRTLIDQYRDTLAWNLEFVWFSLIIGWSGGLHTQDDVSERMRESAQLMLAGREALAAPALPVGG